MGKSQRNKGRRGQTEAANLLRDRDWEVIETSAGQKVEDILALDENNQLWSIEVKNHKLIDLTKFKAQAREQANKRKLPYMVMIRLERENCWLILRKDERATLWFKEE